MTTTTLVILTACVFFSSTIVSWHVANADTLTFDGVTTSGWTLVNGADGSLANELIPQANVLGSGSPGLQFNDLSGGVMYYSAPAAVLSKNFTGKTLEFQYQLNSTHPGGPFQVPLTGFAELYLNGSAISGLDIIDETKMDTLQSVSINFSDPAFSGIDLSNLSSMYIKAEWWGDDVKPSVESYILGEAVPEPSSVVLLSINLLGLFGYSRRSRK